MKKERTRKDLIKNIAIVFLAIMLVLTFFSNTIMNWSLPEVSGKYTEYGEIKTGVRGTGSVISNMTYTETIKGERTVEEVLVNRGTWVEAGQVLMKLGVSDSEQINVLKGEIASLEETIMRALLTKTEYDYTSQELEIMYAEEELNAKKAKRAVFTEEYKLQVISALEQKEAELEKANEEKLALQEEQDEIAEKSLDPEVVKAREAVKKAEDNVESYKNAYDKAVEAFEKETYRDLTSYENSLSSYYDQLDREEQQLEYLKEDYEEELAIDENLKNAKTALDKAISDFEKAVEEFGADSPEASEKEALKNEAEIAYNDALSVYNANIDTVRVALRAIDAQKASISSVESSIYEVRNEMSSIRITNKAYNDRKNTVEIKKNALEEEEKNLENKKKALEEAVEKANVALTEKIKSVNKKIETLTEEKNEAQEKVNELSTIDALDAEIKSSERSLESSKRSLQKQKEADEKAQKLADYDMNKQYKALADKKAELEKYEGKSDDGYELVATHAGTVTEVNFRPGEYASNGASAVVIEVVESGYTVSFSVSNEEAQRVKVGDSATVSDTYWGQKLGAVLTKIIPNTDGKTRTLTFELEGDVSVGQSVTLTVGERSNYYSAVVPKSALHEDSEGKFVYIAKTKSTPLGDRFVATRLPVTVAASDDKNVAISTDDTYLYEYVIVSSTSPFETGDYVRLAD